MAPQMHEYASREALAEALAAGVAAVLAGGIATRGTASLAVSGGSTPKLFLQKLGQVEIDWRNVTVALVDERWVPESNPRSNAAFLRENFHHGPAAPAHLELFFEDGVSAREAEEALSRRFARLGQPIDAVVLGMGADGHTASFFPGSPDLARAIDPDTDASVVAVEAPGAGEPRVTLTLPRLVSARFLALHIEGEDKRQTLTRALEAGPAEALPVRAVLRAAREPALQIFWAP